MCFYSDPDWTAEVVEDTTSAASKPTSCDECGLTIPEGVWVRHVWMQEREVCRLDPESDDYDGPETDATGCPEGCEHDFGETFEYDRCETCDRLIEAIHRHEIKAGCREYESRPSLGELYDAMAEDGRAYLVEAEAMHPGITATLPLCYRIDEDE